MTIRILNIYFARAKSQRGAAEPVPTKAVLEQPPVPVGEGKLELPTGCKESDSAPYWGNVRIAAWVPYSRNHGSGEVWAQGPIAPWLPKACK